MAAPLRTPAAPAPARRRGPNAPDDLAARVARDPRVQRAGAQLRRVFGTAWGRALVWVGCFVPAVYLAWQTWLAWEGLPHDLGGEPVKGLEHATGEQAIRFLLISLCVTPVRQLTGWGWLVKYRRVFGLVMFFYASVHLATFAVLDLELKLGDVGREIVKRPYLTIGFAAWLLLVPLAVTSTQGWIRRLGGARWNRIHALVWPIVTLGMVHYWWSQKKDHSEAYAWGLGFLVLLAWRAWWKRRGARAGGPTLA